MVDTEVGRPMVVTNWGKCYCQASRGTKVEVWISETQADYVGRRWQVEVLNANVLMHVDGFAREKKVISEVGGIVRTRNTHWKWRKDRGLTAICGSLGGRRT